MTDVRATPSPPDENQLISERREKLAAIRAQAKAAGGAAFPNDFKPKHSALDLSRKYGEMPNEELEPQAIKVSLAGRMMLKRIMGKASFCTLQDGSGRIQLFVTRDALGDTTYDAFKHWDLGDIVGALGTLFKTRTGELSVRVTHAAPAHQKPAPAARQVPRHGGPGAEVPAALRGSDHRRRSARALRRAQQGGVGAAPVHGRASLPRSGNADAAPDSGWREREAFRHAPQRAGSGDVPAHRARVVFEAPRRRRLRACFRDQPQLPQRRHLGSAQPRIHDDGVLRRVLEPSRFDGLHRGDPAPRGAPGHRFGEPHLLGPRGSTSRSRSRGYRSPIR